MYMYVYIYIHIHIYIIYTCIYMGKCIYINMYMHTCISGGWKMKLALCCAILQNADILLLDEPTNHLVCPYIYIYIRTLFNTLVHI